MEEGHTSTIGKVLEGKRDVPVLKVLYSDLKTERG